ncbi:Gfo/Idh/MocA family protein [Paenibacillus sp. MBLB4367]|uniref:Gfo/Idh/MocA family protein n=1 Tax=Paenibacillus sp. MBLB4367 TaxID=3384767 RepID=UPI0039080B0D
MGLKIAFLGTGGIAQTHVSRLAKIEGVQVAGFCGTSLEKAERAANSCNGAKGFADFAQMLEEVKPDAVYITTPPMAHGEAELALIERGIPFLVEKPLGVENALVQQLAAKIADKRLITSVGYHWRYYEALATARELLAGSKPGMALGYWMGGMPMVPWWRKQEQSGGQFAEQTTHVVDMLRYLCGEVTEAYAAFAQRAMHEKVEDVSVADVGTVTLKLANGMVATISNTCLLPVGHTVGLDLYTDRGVMEIRSTGLKAIETERTTEYKNKKDPFLLENEAFIHAVRTGDTSGILSDYADSAKTHAVTMAANESAETGAIVRLN